MPDINRPDLARGLNCQPMIIFATAYKQHAFNGFELDAIDYLLKLFHFNALKKPWIDIVHMESLEMSQPSITEYRDLPMHFRSGIDGCRKFNSTKNTEEILSLPQKIPAPEIL
jgi:DNA-binding LytR/AlgR family response regulator